MIVKNKAVVQKRKSNPTIIIYYLMKLERTKGEKKHYGARYIYNIIHTGYPEINTSDNNSLKKKHNNIMMSCMYACYYNNISELNTITNKSCFESLWWFLPLTTSAAIPLSILAALKATRK